MLVCKYAFPGLKFTCFKLKVFCVSNNAYITFVRLPYIISLHSSQMTLLLLICVQDEHNLYLKHPRRRNAHIEALHINLYPATILMDLDIGLIWRML